MLHSIIKFFENHIQNADRADDGGIRALQLATAALLVEITRVDEKIVPEEQQTVLQAIQSTFNLTSEETQDIVTLAEEEAGNATSYYEFTSMINKRFEMPEKIRLIEMMWRVAFADRSLQRYEEHLIRKLADLLYIPHRVFITAKLKVQEEMSGG